MSKSTINCWIIPVDWYAIHPSMIPSLRSECVQRCSEKFISFRALFWALELNEKMLSGVQIRRDIRFAHREKPASRAPAVVIGSRLLGSERQI
jgi:hypothetical protein